MTTAAPQNPKLSASIRHTENYNGKAYPPHNFLKSVTLWGYFDFLSGDLRDPNFDSLFFVVEHFPVDQKQLKNLDRNPLSKMIFKKNVTLWDYFGAIFGSSEEP